MPTPPQHHPTRPAQPQRLIRLQEVCDTCGGLDTFRVRAVIGPVVYVACKACHRSGTRVTVPRGTIHSTPKKL